MPVNQADYEKAAFENVGRLVEKWKNLKLHVEVSAAATWKTTHGPGGILTDLSFGPSHDVILWVPKNDQHPEYGTCPGVVFVGSKSAATKFAKRLIDNFTNLENHHHERTLQHHA